MAKVLRMKRKTIVEVFIALGYKTAGKWDGKRLLAKVKKLPELVEAGTAMTDPKIQKALEALIKAGTEGYEVNFPEEGSEEQVTPVEKIEQKQTIDTKALVKEVGGAIIKENIKQKKKKTEKKERQPSAGKDKMGCRIGSQAANINATLSEKPKDAEDISKEVKVPKARIIQHLRYMVGKKLVEQDAAGKFFIG